MIGQNSSLSGKCHKWCTHIYSFMDHNIKMMKNTVFIVDNNVYWKWHLKCIHSSIYLKTNVKGYIWQRQRYMILYSISPTLPEDLTPLHKQRKMTIHAMARQINSSQRMVPKSSIPSVICKTSFLRTNKFSYNYIKINMIFWRWSDWQFF